MQTRIFYDLTFSPDDGWYASIFQATIKNNKPVGTLDLVTTDIYNSREKAEARAKKLYPQAELLSVFI